MPSYKWMFCIAFFTDETLALMESFPNLMIIFCHLGSKAPRNFERTFEMLLLEIPSS